MQEGVLLLNKVGNIKLDEASYCLETLHGIFIGQIKFHLACDQQRRKTEVWKSHWNYHFQKSYCWDDGNRRVTTEFHKKCCLETLLF